MMRFLRLRPAGRRRRAAACAAGVAAFLAAGVSPAAAADNYLEFSLDGMAYSTTASGPVLSESFTYNPGASSTSFLWIRNTSSEPASLSTAAVMVRSAAELDGYLGLSAGMEPALSNRSPLGSEGTCTDVGQPWNIAPGESRKLNLAVDLSAEAPNSTMNRTADVDLLFLLQPVTAGNTTRPACDALTDTGDLPAGPDAAPEPSTGARPGSPAGPGPETAGSSRLTTLPGLRTAPAAAEPARVRAVGLAAGPGVGTGAGLSTGINTDRSNAPVSAAQPPTEIVPASFQSTVEPIIRSLSGTLLIGMSVVFAAAVVLRVRSRQA